VLKKLLPWGPKGGTLEKSGKEEKTAESDSATGFEKKKKKQGTRGDTP